MQSKGARIGVAVVAVAAIVVLFAVLRGGGEEEPTSTATTPAPHEESGGEPDAGAQVNPPQKPKPEPQATTEIEVEGGAPVGGAAGVSLDSGEKARIVVTTADTTDHVHLHGYDVVAELAPGRPAELEFTAEIDGVFEVELEQTAVAIAEVTVGES